MQITPVALDNGFRSFCQRRLYRPVINAIIWNYIPIANNDEAYH